MGPGDAIAKALSIVGITPERVSRWLGKECGCKDRKERLNAAWAWAKRVLGGRTEKAEEHLAGMMGVESEKQN